LVFHDGAGPETIVCLQVTCKSGDRRHADNDFEFLAILIGLNTAINNSSSDLVPDWVLSIVCSGDEELVLDVDKVLAITDDSDVGICNRVLEG
jgi:hypothetical protein